MPAKKLRVVSFNIFYALRSKRLTKTAVAAFAALKPDVVCLQEVLIGKKKNFARDLADALGYHLSFSLRTALGARKIGLAVLTKKMPAENASVILPHSSKRRPRILQIVDADVNGSRWRIANTHLNHPYLALFKARHTQLQAILTALNNKGLPTILVGDFNTKTKKEVKIFTDSLQKAGFRVPKGLPHTAHLLGLKWHFDWIAARHCTVATAGVLQYAKGSDHKPVWADIAYPVVK